MVYSAWLATVANDALHCRERPGSHGAYPSTITRTVAAIDHRHRAGGYPSLTAMPTAGSLADVLGCIRGEHCGAKLQKHPADGAAPRKMPAVIDGYGLRALRDHAVLAIGMAAALQHSEIVALQVEHIGIVSKRLRLTIGHSRTERIRQGIGIAISEGSCIRLKALLPS